MELKALCATFKATVLNWIERHARFISGHCKIRDKGEKDGIINSSQQTADQLKLKRLYDPVCLNHLVQLLEMFLF